jgi:hypothetical protein
LRMGYRAALAAYGTSRSWASPALNRAQALLS